MRDRNNNMQGSPIVVGIVGDSASGKTTIANGLAKILGENRIARLNCDDYHRYSRAQRIKHGLSAVHTEGYFLDIVDQHLSLLKQGNPVLKPVIDPGMENFLAPQYVEPKPIVLVEGLLGYFDHAMRARYDLRLFLEPASEVRIRWKIRHDTGRFGRSEAAVVKELAQLKVDEEALVRPQRRWADIVVRFAPSERYRHDTGPLLSASMVLRPSAPDIGLYELMQRINPGPAMRLELDRDMGLPVDRMVIEGDIGTEQCAAMQRAMWAAIYPGEKTAVGEAIGEFTSESGTSSSRSLALTLLIVALHVGKLESGRAAALS